MKIVTAVKGTILSVILASTLTASVGAAPNTSTYTMSRSGNTIAVNVTNNESVDSVEARFAYSGNVDAFDISVANGTSFGTCIDARTSGIACSSASAVAPGSYRVATITLSPKAGASSATISVSVTVNSSVLAFADGSETLNKGNLPGTSYSYTAPAPSNPTPSNPTPSNPGTSTPNNGGSAPRTPAVNNTSTNTPADTTPTGGEVAGAETKKEAPKAAANTPKNTAATVAKTSSNKTWMWALLLIPVAAAAYVLARKFRPVPVVASKSSKKISAKKQAPSRKTTTTKARTAKATR